jgi:ABC-type branched-subunit amino acid transport system substrate-binding protein
VPRQVVPSGAPVKIGFVVSDGADAAFSAFGFGGVTTGDQRNQVNALVTYVNQHGGLRGHRIQPVFYNWSPANTAEQEGAAACAYFTQDERVFAVVDPIGGSPGYVRCLTRAGVVLVATYNAQSEAVVRQTGGRYFTPADPTPDRFAREFIKQLPDLGFFSSGAKIGLLTYDTPEMKDLTERVIKPGLAARGLRLTDEAAFDPSAYASQGPSFAFRFKANGVTHVLNLATGSIVFFQQAAEQQQYRPRYALSSRDGPGAWVQLLAPAAQLRNSLGIGWQPTADVDLAHSPGDVSPNQTLCRRLMKDAGEDMSSQLVQVASHRYCEGTLFLSTVAARTDALSVPGFTAAAAAIKTAYPPVLTFRTYFSGGRVDGPDQARPFTYQVACSCFAYSGPPRTLSRSE